MRALGGKRITFPSQKEIGEKKLPPEQEGKGKRKCSKLGEKGETWSKEREPNEGKKFCLQTWHKREKRIHNEKQGNLV